MTARQIKLERVRKHLTDIPANASRADMRASILAAIGGMNDLVRQEEGLPIVLPPLDDFSARLRLLSRDMSAAVALSTKIRNGVLS